MNIWDFGALSFFITGLGILVWVVVQGHYLAQSPSSSFSDSNLHSSLDEISSLSDTSKVTQNQQVLVSVVGAVKKPGIFTLSSNDRVADAVASSGGFLGTAYLSWVNQHLNLAQKLSDEMTIYIPFKNDETSLEDQTGGRDSQSININAASLQELMNLKGIGEARAQHIIENRPYTSLEDFKQKTGLSDSLFDQIRAQLILR